MSSPFTRPALICNSASGGFDDAVFDRIYLLCRDAGTPILRTWQLADDAMPDAAALVAENIDLLIVWTGDGSINAATTASKGWDGALLPLPGGTLNLLSKSLHGDRAAPDILADALAGKGERAKRPIIRCTAGDAYITVVAGPATRWADVRETLRRDGLVGAGQAAPEAMEAMLNAPGVRIRGSGEGSYQAILLTPTPAGIGADGIRTARALDILQHGIAWLRGDFRDGPSDHLVTAKRLALASKLPISVELDGELAQLGKSATFRSAISAVDFFATAPNGDASVGP